METLALILLLTLCGISYLWGYFQCKRDMNKHYEMKIKRHSDAL